MRRTVDKPNIFISYRRADAAANAGRLFDWLGHQFGRVRVFLDTDKIQAGAKFPEVLEERLLGCDVLLVVIGPDWLTAADEQGRRLDQPQDFVRREIETALVGGKAVIPVLVQGAEMPGKEELPSSIQDLADRNAVYIGDASFERDFDVLVDDVLGRPRGFMRRELDRLQRMVLVASRSAIVVPILAVVIVLACFMKVFDFFSLDTRASSYLVWAADVISGPPPDSNVLLVNIDTESEQKLRPFNVENRAEWRRDHAQLINRAASAGAEAVVFDISLSKESPADNELADAVRNANAGQTRTVFGITDFEQERPVMLESLIQAGAEWGSLCAIKRLHLYMAPLLVRRPENETSESLFDNNPVPGHIPSLSLAAIRSGTPDLIDLSRRKILFSGLSRTRPVEYSSLERINFQTDDCGTLAEGDEVAMLLIRVPDPEYWRDNSRHLSYADVLEPGLVTDDQLHDRIILVGGSSSRDGETRDIHPVSRFFSRVSIPGVELQASAIADLQTGRVIRTPTIGWQAFIISVMALLGAGTSFFTATHSRGWQRMVFSIVVIAYICVAVLFSVGGLLLNILYDLAAFFVTHSLLRWMQKRALRFTKTELEL